MDFAGFVLAASTANLTEEPAARGIADAVEFRMDLAADPTAALAAYDGELPLIATNRARWEGGEAGAREPGGAGETDRLRTLARATSHDAVEAVDVELRSADLPAGVDAVERAREAGAAVIVSVHDFEGTPDEHRLRELLSDAAAVGDVAKLAVTAHGPDDVLALLSATRALDRAGERVATMAMGEAGRHSRAVAPLYGSRIGYAPVDPAAATAPGQFDLRTLADLLATLRGEPEG
ncbi:MAG: type I 3-dehydroquinate dehydratase [Halobacteriales archaeon]